MKLVLSSQSVLNTVFTNESGQVVYKTDHPFKLNISKGTTTFYKIKPNDDPMDMRDQFEAFGKIEWHPIGSSVFHINGQELQSNDFLPSHGIWGRKRTFTGPDGCPYRWDMEYDKVVLSRDDLSRTVIAQYKRKSLGIIGPKRPPLLEINDDMHHMFDLIILTFVYVEKLRVDRDDEAMITN